MKIGILGAGTWGIALSVLLAKNGHEITVWSAISDEIDILESTHTHKNLPGLIIPNEINYTKDITEVAKNNILLIVVPSAFVRSTVNKLAPHIQDNTILINASKGIEPITLMTMTEVISDEIDKTASHIKYSVSALSGPTHAEEVAVGIPTSIVSACENEQVSRFIAELFQNSCMRVYTNTDVKGVEISGAMKNIIAIAAGINNGMGFGDNSKAMLITRGIAEITRLGLAMGCHRRTFMGLAGIGDLIVTCTSLHSRNNRCGELIGQGYSYEEASSKIGMVVEGYYALEAAIDLSLKYNVELPITEAVNDVIKKGVTPSVALEKLMMRDMKSELDS